MAVMAPRGRKNVGPPRAPDGGRRRAELALAHQVPSATLEIILE
jgi:hypothetical protein